MSGGDFEAEMRERLEHAARDRTVPNVVVHLKSRQIGVTEVQRMHDEALGLPQGFGGLLERPNRSWARNQAWVRARHHAKLRRAAPSLLILAGCGCFAVSLWPDPLTLAGCGCFVVATVLNLVGCVR